MNLKVYIVIGYDSILDAEEIKGVWFSKMVAERYRGKHNYLRVEKHEIIDASSIALELLGQKED